MTKQELIDGLKALAEFVRESDTEDEAYYLNVIDNVLQTEMWGPEGT